MIKIMMMIIMIMVMMMMIGGGGGGMFSIYDASHGRHGRTGEDKSGICHRSRPHQSLLDSTGGRQKRSLSGKLTCTIMGTLYAKNKAKIKPK